MEPINQTINGRPQRAATKRKTASANSRTQGRQTKIHKSSPHPNVLPSNGKGKAGVVDEADLCILCHDGGTVYVCSTPGCDANCCVDAYDGDEKVADGCINIGMARKLPEGYAFKCPPCHDEAGTYIPYSINVVLRKNISTTGEPPVLVLHLYLSEFAPGARESIDATIRAFFERKLDRLHIANIEMNDQDENPSAVGGIQYSQKMLERTIAWMDEYQPRKVFITISTHSDLDSGRLFFASKPECFSDYPSEVLKAYLGSALRTKLRRIALKNFTRVSLAIISCGAVVTHSLDDVRGLVVRAGSDDGFVKDIIAFSTSRFVPWNVQGDTASYAENIMLLNMEPFQAFQSAFANSKSLLHTNVVFVGDDRVCQVVHGNNDFAPFGILPPDCLACSSNANWILNNGRNSININGWEMSFLKETLIYDCRCAGARWKVNKPPRDYFRPVDSTILGLHSYICNFPTPEDWRGIQEPVDEN